MTRRIFTIFFLKNITKTGQSTKEVKTSQEERPDLDSDLLSHNVESIAEKKDPDEASPVKSIPLPKLPKSIHDSLKGGSCALVMGTLMDQLESYALTKNINKREVHVVRII